MVTNSIHKLSNHQEEKILVGDGIEPNICSMNMLF